MNLLVTGSHGLVGSALIPALTMAGHKVTRLTRSPSNSSDQAVQWDPATGKIELSQLEGFNAVVHLAGEGIASGRWHAEKKVRIRESRVLGTRHLCEALAKLSRPPQVLVSASAIGYYGSRGVEVLKEESGPGTGFLAEVCRDWELATEPAAQKGIRVVRCRSGVILSPAGGALAKMLFPFKMGGGGKIGDGRQYMSWIALDDAVRALQHVLSNEAVQGPVNVVSPQPVTNYEFTKSLGKVLWRPTVLPIPAFAARLAFGEMADELLLCSQRVLPARLQETGFSFHHPTLEDALRHLLGKTAA